MMNMFYGGTMIGFWPFHLIFNLIFIVGLALLIVWFAKYLIKENQLLVWAAILTVIGILGMLFTFGGNMFGMMGNWNQPNIQGMYQHMMGTEYENYDTPEAFRNHMIEEMEEYMGL